MPNPSPSSSFSHPPGWLLIVGVLFLFSIWSNSFIAIEYLLTNPEPGGVNFNWFTLTAARFAPVGLVAILWCGLRWPRRSLEIIRKHWPRLVGGGLFNITGYSFALYYAQQKEVAAPIASLMTTLAPLFLMLLAATFLGERLTRRRVFGFLIALGGVVIIAMSKEGGGSTYPLYIAIAAGAPLSWALFSVITKPITRECGPMLLTLLTLAAGSAPYMVILPFAGMHEMTQLSGNGWTALLFLSVFATLIGFWIWTWLLKHLPASVVGFTVFLNPPMTTAYKSLLVWLAPALFTFTLVPGEVAGGIVALAGVAVATLRRRAKPVALVEHQGVTRDSP